MFGKKAKYQVQSSNDCASMSDAIEGALDIFEKAGLEGKDGEPDVTVVIRSNKGSSEGYRTYDCHVFTGASKEEILKELTEKL